jgi:hypothetical protein
VRAALVSGDFSRLLVGMTALLYLVIGSAVIFLLLVLPDGSYVTGLEWGTRNLLTLYPLGVGLSLAALVDYWRSKRPPLVKRLVVGLTLTLVLVSSLLQARGAQMLRQSRDLVLQWQEAMPANQPIVTDAWWLPLAMAPFYTEHVMYCTRDPDQLSEWAARAARADVDGFVFASVEPLGRERLRSVAGVEWEGLNLVSGLQLNRFRIVADAAD